MSELKTPLRTWAYGHHSSGIVDRDGPPVAECTSPEIATTLVEAVNPRPSQPSEEEARETISGDLGIAWDIINMWSVGREPYGKLAERIAAALAERREKDAGIIDDLGSRFADGIAKATCITAAAAIRAGGKPAEPPEPDTEVSE